MPGRHVTAVALVLTSRVHSHFVVSVGAIVLTKLHSVEKSLISKLSKLDAHCLCTVSDVSLRLPGERRRPQVRVCYSRRRERSSVRAHAHNRLTWAFPLFFSEEPPKTTLTQFFALCQKDAFAKTILYPNIPKYYTWNDKEWKPRRRCKPVSNYPGKFQSDTIGRVYTVHPNNVECFHLRLLLHTIPGPSCKVDEVICETNREACRLRGLGTLLLRKLRFPKCRLKFVTCSQSCFIFAQYLILSHFGKPTKAMSEDYLHRQRQSASVPNLPFTQTIFNQCLIYIEDKLLSFPGENPLSTYGLPSPNRSDDETTTLREILAEYAYDREEMQQIVIEREPTLTSQTKLTHTMLSTE